jgi:hypothetical protein
MKDLYLDNGSKLSELYHAITDEKCKTDEEALALLYPDASGTGSYRYTKGQLKKRLLNYLFFIDLDLPSFTDRQKAFLECHKKWAIVNILFGRGARAACVDVAKGLLKKAIHYEFNEIVADVAKLLRFHFGGMVMDKKNYHQYRDLYDQYGQYYFNENQIEGAYVDIIFSNFDERFSKEELAEYIQDAYARVEPLLEQTPSYKGQLYGFLIKILLDSSLYNNEEMIASCQRAIDFFESKPYQANTPLQIFYYQQLIGFSQLRQFERGRHAAERCMSFLEEGTYNWFKFQESFFILAMHSGEYMEGYAIFENVIEHNRFGVMPKDLKEIWKIYEAYLYLVLNEKEKEDIEEIAPKVSKFRLGRFLNEIPIFSKEKRGMNIAILVIHTLIHIQRKQYNKAIDRIEAIEKYCNRHLRDKETLRSFYFIKMLLAIPSHSFHEAAVLRHTEKYKKKLHRLPLEVVSQDHKIEVVPYEDLWQISLGLLDKKHVSIRRS